jgi:hypothetical protein
MFWFIDVVISNLVANVGDYPLTKPLPVQAEAIYGTALGDEVT